MKFLLPFMFFLLSLSFAISIDIYRKKSLQEKAEKKLRAAAITQNEERGDISSISRWAEGTRKLLLRHPRTICLVLPCAFLYLITRSFWSLPLSIPLYWLLPRFIEKFRESRKRKIIEVQLFDFVDCMIQSLEGGSSVFQSLDFAASEMEEPLSSELQKAVTQINLGEEFEDAMKTLGERINHPDLHVILTAIILLKQSGGNLPSLLRKLREMMQDRQEIQREIKVFTVQGRLSGYVVSALPVAFLLIESAFSRKFVRPLFTTPSGLILLVVGLLMETIGFLWIRKISRLGVDDGFKETGWFALKPRSRARDAANISPMEVEEACRS